MFLCLFVYTNHKERGMIGPLLVFVFGPEKSFFGIVSLAYSIKDRTDTDKKMVRQKSQVDES